LSIQRILVVLLVAGFMGLGWVSSTFAVASPSPNIDESDLSQENWDEETAVDDQEAGDGMTEAEDDQTAAADDGAEDSAIAESWEDEEAEEDEDGLSAQEVAAAELKQQRLTLLADQERFLHLWGFTLFAVYLVGGVLTAYFTRHHRLIRRFPPELLILLHTFWPLELLLLPFGRRKSA